MTFFFELIENRIGFSRIGRVNLSKEKKLYIKTPNILIPIKNILMKQFSFIQEFENHDLFIISKEIFLQIGFLREKFKDTGFIFSFPGTLEKFKEILEENLEIFTKDNVLAIIPFNIPTTAIDRAFAEREVKHYLSNAALILNKYPNINFGLSIRLFNYPMLINLYFPTIKGKMNIKLLNLMEIFDNFKNVRNILNTISIIKNDFDNNLVILASGKIIPKFYPILIYLGVDLIDSSYLLYLSSKDLYDTTEYLTPLHKVNYFPCSCVACKTKLKNLKAIRFSSEKKDLLCLHNLITTRNYMMKIKQYLHQEDYRAFVEKSSFDDISIISILKILDKEYFNIVKYETPILQKDKLIKCLGPSSYFRPDFREFRGRLINNFEPESWTTLIILLPCSAKKPYSQSKSHKLFLEVIRKFPKFQNFQEIILTSPLGAIPRQLENVYPVNSYDVSVTGEWDEEELQITSNMLIKILLKYNKSIPVICHLEGEYVKIAENVNSKVPHNFFFSKIESKVTSKASLALFENLINQHLNDFVLADNLSQVNYLSKNWIRKFVKILDYQFGIGIGRYVINGELKPIKIKSKSYINLIDSKSQEILGIFRFSLGQVFLKMKGLKKLPLLLIKSKIIVFNGQKISGSTLFRPGIIEYGQNLIPNEHVLIVDIDKKRIIGAGTLLVGTNFIKNSKTGRIVEIYEKI
ncbi:hypothetical protein LCGC14_1111410 [marine sediment metagenome]|uniref:PUA domain-containing protein n=1 Tax=marine sediment metagenome TaxID=412755 RepID=A0A0F9QCQ4_9ZZZZ|nr:MAG: Archaeosine synthase [Candidatus Lokiarchaeum sp. GC14_75]